jgi:DNA-binding response OmpR family regulator
VVVDPPQVSGAILERDGDTKDGKPAKILLAEDEAGTRYVLEALLQRWGYSVVGVPDGQDAWEVLQGDDPPQLAILDWIMPRMDGLELCRRVRASNPDGLPYLLLLTGRGGRDDLIAGLEGGADAYLTKPIEPEELRARVRAGLRVVAMQSRLIHRVRGLETALRDGKGATQDRTGLTDTLRLCIAAFNETLTLDEIPRHLRAALRLCAGLCLEALGEREGSGAKSAG